MEKSERRERKEIEVIQRSRTSRTLAWCAFSVLLILTGDLLAQSPEAHQQRKYESHQVVRVQLSTAREMQTVSAIGAIPWSCRVGPGAPEYVVSPEQRDALVAANIRFDVLIADVQTLIDAERQENELAREGGIASDPLAWFTAYRTNAEVSIHMDDLAALHPDLVEKITVGTSHERRTIHGLRIASPTAPANRPVILLNGCQHAREWISVMVPMYIADQLVRKYDEDAQIQTLLDQIEFLVVPIVNPDGYAYTHDPDGNRMWRKNRRVNGGGAFGVDLNRNWEVDWNGPHSTSNNPTSDVYVGPFAMSEPETQAMRDLVLANPGIVAHIDFHSYSQLILQPLGYTSDPPADAVMLDALGAQMSDAIANVHNEEYIHGPAGDILYFASGVFEDWTYVTQGIFGYTIELRPKTFFPGFLLPPSEIIPTSEENFAAVLAMADFSLKHLTRRPAPCIGDLDHNGHVNVFDLLALLGAWGECASSECPGDLDESGAVDVFDLLTLLGAWGECR